MAGRVAGSGGWGRSGGPVRPARRQPVHPFDTAFSGATLFHRRFVARDETTRHVLQDLIACLGQADVPPKAIANAELILAEILNNVVEHAYAGRAGLIELWLSAKTDGLVCNIADQGQPFPGGAMPKADLPPVSPPDNVPEGGFGWHIIRSLAVGLHYRRRGDWNLLTLEVPLG